MIDKSERPPDAERIPGTETDITARDPLQGTLRYRSGLFEHISDAVVCLDLQFKILSWNNAAEMMYGWSAGEVVGKLSEQVFKGEYPGQDSESLVQQLCARGFLKRKGTHKRKDGREIQVVVALSLLKDDAGNPVGAVGIVRDIAGNTRAQQAVQESEERFRQLFVSHKAIMLLLEPESGVIVDANPSAVRFYGYPHEKLCGMSIDEINMLPPEQVALERRRANTEELGYFIFPHRTASGEIRTVEVRSSPIDTGGRRLLFSIIQDITERIRAEEALRESEERYKQMFEQASLAINITRGTDVLYANSAYLKMFGFSSLEDVKALAPLEIFTPEWRPAILENIQRRAQGQPVPNAYEAECFRRDGTRFPVLMNFSRTVFSDGPATVGFIFDISEGKRVEAALRDSEERYRELVENASDVVYTVDLVGNFNSANRAAERITGYTHEEILSLNLAQIMSPSDFALARQMLQSKVTSGQPTTYSVDIFARDGHTVSLELSTRLIYHEGRPVGSQGIARDITERKRLQEELRQQATTDDLTGVSNRRRFLELANREMKRAVRLKHPLAMVLLDIDRLKTLNDTYGHAAGDQALAAFAKTCKKNIREIDLFARFGGDEFALLLPETNREQAYEAIERVRMALASAPLDLQGKSVPITVSAGISSLANEDESLDSLLGRADQVLYRAKEMGRDRVEVEDFSR